jgi:cell division protein FtsL
MKTSYDILSHPLTIAVVVTIFTSIGALIGMMISNAKDNSQFKQAIMDLRELVIKLTGDHDDTKKEVSDLKQRFNRVEGQHDMVIRSGEILKNHNG